MPRFHLVALAATMAGMLLGPQAVLADFLDGNELLDRCSVSELDNLRYQKTAMCQGYVSGALDMLDFIGDGGEEKVCPSGRVTVGQAVDVMINYLQAHPDRRHLPGSILVVLAMRQAFACPE